MAEPSPAVYPEFLNRRGLPTCREEQFDRSTTERNLLHHARERARLAIEAYRRIPSGLIPEVQLAFFDVGNVQGFAAVEEGVPYVTLSRGAALLLMQAALRLMSHPETLLDIGDPEREEYKPYHERIVPRNYYIGDPSLGQGDRIMPFVPRCPVRQEHAIRLAGTAVDWLVLHELGHIRHGHCAFLARRGVDSLAEAVGVGGPGGSMRGQSLEMDADCFATLATLQAAIFLEGCVPGIESLIVQPCAGQIYPGAPRALCESVVLRDFLVATVLVFSVFGLESVPANLESLTHPPNSVRYRYIIDIISRRYEQMGVDRLECYNADLRRMLPDVGRCIRVLGGEVAVEAFIGGMVSETSDYLVRLSEAWTQLRPELLEHSYVQELAP